MGALTSKRTQFNFRPWENKAIDSADFLDSFCTPIQVNVRGNTIMRVLPRLSTDKKFPWISDRTRFFVDGLTKQRIQTPIWRKHFEPYNYTTDYPMGHIKNTQSANLFTISWNYAFNLIKRYYTSSATAILGPNVDYPSIAMTAAIFNNIAMDTGGSRIPSPSIRHIGASLFGMGEGDAGINSGGQPLSVALAHQFFNLLKPNVPPSRHVGYFIINLNLRSFRLLGVYIEQLATYPGHEQNKFYLFGNNFSMWSPLTQYVGGIPELSEYMAGRLHGEGIIQMQDFEYVVLINGRYGEMSDFLTADDLAKILLDNNWGLKHKNVYIFDLPNNPRDYALGYMNIRNSFYPRWTPEEINHDNLLYLHENPYVATVAQNDMIDFVETTQSLEDAEIRNGIRIRFSHPDWRTAPGVNLKHLASMQPARAWFSQKAHKGRALRTTTSFKVFYGSHGSQTSSRADLSLPARTPFEDTAKYNIDCFGRIAKFAFCYSGPTYSKGTIDMFTELSDILQIPLSLHTPNPLTFDRVSSTPFFVETPIPAFTHTVDTYVYDEYRIDAITKASPMLALCSERFTPRDINFDITSSN